MTLNRLELDLDLFGLRPLCHGDDVGQQAARRGRLSAQLFAQYDMATSAKDKNIAPRTIRLLRQVTSVRQIEIAELMVATDNYTTGYVEALIFGTPQDQIHQPATVKKRRGFTREYIARLEAEMETLHRDFKSVEAGYGQNVLHLTLARAYIRKLLENADVARFLQSSQPDIHAEFEKLAATEGL